MTDDTISTDPKMKEEARRAQAESAFPKLPYDPKAIAREEFERVVDVRYCNKSFDELWGLFTGDIRITSTGGDALGVLTEAEYRQFTASLMYAVQNTFLKNAAEQAKERGTVLHKAAMFTSHDRLKITGTTPQELHVDLAHGLLRKHVEPKKTCPVHPDGCPEDGASMADFGKFLLSLFAGRK